MRSKIPELHYMAQANRIFLQRAAGAIARAGVGQFIEPDAKGAYVDADFTDRPRKP